MGPTLGQPRKVLKGRANVVKEHLKTTEKGPRARKQSAPSKCNPADKHRKAGRRAEENSPETFWERTRRAPSGVEGSAVKSDMRPCLGDKSRRSTSQVVLRNPARRPGVAQRCPLPTPAAWLSPAGSNVGKRTGGAASPYSRSPRGPSRQDAPRPGSYL